MPGRGRQQPSARYPRRRGRLPLGSLFGPSWPWAGARAGPSRPSPLGLLRPKAAMGQSVPVGRPSSNKKKCFLFFFYYLGREILWKMFMYSFLLQKW
jgi:hypothetical protein